MADFYQILGVSRDADADTLKRAYRRLARQYHPDVNKEPGAEDKFKEIGKAYEALADPETRARYDQFGEAGLGGAAGMPDMGDMGALQIYLKLFLMALEDKLRRAEELKEEVLNKEMILGMTLMLILKMQYLANKKKLQFLILRHVKSVGEQVLNQEPDQKLAQLVEEADKLEELQEHHLVISHK